MKVLFAASEVSPFAKVGGLADVVGSLPGALRRERVETRVVMPKYRVIRPELMKDAVFLGSTYIAMGWRRQYAGLFSLVRDGITYYFIDNEYYFGGVYTAIWRARRKNMPSFRWRCWSFYPLWALSPTSCTVTIGRLGLFPCCLKPALPILI